MKLYGVFVGINKYKDKKISSLSYAVTDAQELFSLFNRSLLPDEQELYLLIDQQATRSKILEVTGETLASKVTSDDIVVLFFSGHGSPELASDNQAARYLIAHDTERDHIFSTGINLETELTDLFKRLTAKLIVLFADTCFSGAAGGRTFEGPRLRLYREQMRLPISLKSLSFGEGRLMISACEDDQIAFETSKLSHGIFTHFLIYGLTDPNHPIDGIGIMRLYEDVAQLVNGYTNGKQTPVLNGRATLAKLPRLEK